MRKILVTLILTLITLVGYSQVVVKSTSADLYKNGEYVESANLDVEI